MCTFGVRTPSRVLLPVGTDAEEAEESFLLRPLPLCESLLLAMPSESLPRFHTILRFHYHIKGSPLLDHYRRRHLLLAHPSPFSLICRLPPFVPFLMAALHLVVVLLPAVSATVAVDVLVSPPLCGGANSC